jgi:hypothetical protein
MQEPISFEGKLLNLIIEGNDDEAQRRILTEMLPGEQAALAKHADWLAHLCRRPQRIRDALAEGCRWSRRCTGCAAGYYDSGYRHGRSVSSNPHFDAFHGICAQHRPAAEENGFTVLDPPAEVKL